MRQKTAVVLITGFLGSGKTTFLNRIISTLPSDVKLAILMNEFGEIGIDGTLVEGENIDMIEISRGSIFCVCVKTDFLKGLYELNATIQPDLLIIESTGVADPTDLKRDLQLPIFNDRFVLAEQFCIIDGVHFLEAFAIFASVEKQLETSTVFIINKTDLAGPGQIAEIKETIRKHHPDPQFYETTFAEIPPDCLPFPDGRNQGNNSEPAGNAVKPLAQDDLQAYIDGMLDNPESAATPPDELASVIYTWHGSNFDEIRKMAANLPSSIVRAKGFIGQDSEVYIFSYVMGDWTIDSCSRTSTEIQHLNMIVFIGTLEGINGIQSAFTTARNWTARQVVQPFGRISAMR